MAELANVMRVSPEEILDARHASDSQFGGSLDEPAQRDGDDSLVDTLGGEDLALTGAADAVALDRWLAELPQRQHEIVRMRFEEDLTQGQIAERCGISQMHVSRLLRRSLEDLRVMSRRQPRGS